MPAQVPNVGIVIRMKPVAEDVNAPQFGAEVKDSAMSSVTLVSPQLDAGIGSTTDTVRADRIGLPMELTNNHFNNNALNGIWIENVLI